MEKKDEAQNDVLPDIEPGYGRRKPTPLMFTREMAINTLGKTNFEILTKAGLLNFPLKEAGGKEGR